MTLVIFMTLNYINSVTQGKNESMTQLRTRHIWQYGFFLPQFWLIPRLKRTLFTDLSIKKEPQGSFDRTTDLPLRH